MFGFHGSMVPPYFWESGTMEPWNQGSRLHILGSRLHILGSMVPWFHPNFFWVEPWNHGTLVPGYTFEVPWFHGSGVEPWNHGTMEPKCVLCLISYWEKKTQYTTIFFSNVIIKAINHSSKNTLLSHSYVVHRKFVCLTDEKCQKKRQRSGIR